MRCIPSTVLLEREREKNQSAIYLQCCLTICHLFFPLLLFTSPIFALTREEMEREARFAQLNNSWEEIKQQLNVQEKHKCVEANRG